MTTGTVSVLISNIPLISISRSLYLDNFSIIFVELQNSFQMELLCQWSYILQGLQILLMRGVSVTSASQIFLRAVLLFSTTVQCRILKKAIKHDSKCCGISNYFILEVPSYKWSLFWGPIQIFWNSKLAISLKWYWQPLQADDKKDSTTKTPLKLWSHVKCINIFQHRPFYYTCLFLVLNFKFASLSIIFKHFQKLAFLQ